MWKDMESIKINIIKLNWNSDIVIPVVVNKYRHQECHSSRLKTFHRSRGKGVGDQQQSPNATNLFGADAI